MFLVFYMYLVKYTPLCNLGEYSCVDRDLENHREFLIHALAQLHIHMYTCNCVSCTVHVYMYVHSTHVAAEAAEVMHVYFPKPLLEI